MTKTPVLPQTALEAAGAVVTPTSLSLQNPDLPWDTYERLGEFLGELNKACAWWVGDLVLFGEQVYGEAHAQIEEALGLAPQTIANRASVARHVPPSARRASLPFGTHAEVAYLEPRERDKWLSAAEKGGWTRSKLRDEMRLSRGEPLSGSGRSGPNSGGSQEVEVLPPDPPNWEHTRVCPHCGGEL